MQLSDGTLLQMLLRSRNIMACRQVCDDLLASPSTIENPCFGVTEAPFQIWHDAIVSALCAEIVWVLEIDLLVRPS